MAAAAEYINRAPMKLTDMERAVACALFAMSEQGDREHDLWDVEADVAWFKRLEVAMLEPHHGDCTNVPMGCTRCHLEDYTDIARRIIAALHQ